MKNKDWRRAYDADVIAGMLPLALPPKLRGDPRLRDGDAMEFRRGRFGELKTRTIRAKQRKVHK
jgi:hypothetical protein